MSGAAAGTAVNAGGFSLVSGLVQMVAALAVVVGLIIVFHYVSRRWLKGGVASSSHHRYIRIVESRFIAPKKSLMLVEVSGEYMLLGSCGDTINLIKQIDMMEEVEVIGEVPSVPFGETFRDKLKSFAARFPITPGTCAGSLRKGGAGW